MSVKKSEGALYKEIEANLRHRIQSGQWPAGTMLPSRRDLAREHGVSSLTVERAITPLISAGLLRADDRRGTFVIDTSQSVRDAQPPAVTSPTPPLTKSTTVGIVGSLN